MQYSIATFENSLMLVDFQNPRLVVTITSKNVLILGKVDPADRARVTQLLQGRTCTVDPKSFYKALNFLTYGLEVEVTFKSEQGNVLTVKGVDKALAFYENNKNIDVHSIVVRG